MSIDQYPGKTQKLIEKNIVSGSFKSGTILNILDLIRSFDLSEGNISTVISALKRKGLVVQLDDRSIKVLGLPSAKIESVFQYAQKSKLKPTTVVRDLSVKPADAFLSEKLSVGVGAPVFQQIRTRLVDGQILANQYNFIPYEICPTLEDVDLSRRSFQVTLEEDFHTVITRIEENYFLGEPERDDRQILNLDENKKILVIERISYSRNEMPVVYADIHVNPAKFHYVAKLWPEAENLLKKHFRSGEEI